MLVRLPWGDEEITIPLPDTWQYRGEIKARSSLDRISREQIRNVLRNPVEQVPLSARDLSGRQVVVVVDDITRPTPVKTLFPEVMSELEKGGVKKENLKIVFSLGNHRPMTRREMQERLGVDDLASLQVENHDCNDPKQLKFLGSTSSDLKVVLNRRLVEADLIILIGTIEPHPLAGFGGGLKNVIPGCAGSETIAGTHLLGEASVRFAGTGRMGEECPTRQWIEAGAKMVKAEYFLVNTVLQPDGEIAGLYCGDPVLAHRQGCRQASQIYGAAVDKKAEVVLVGSSPMDIDLWQGSKCIGNAVDGVKDDGLIIAFIRCYQGIGDLKVPEGSFLNQELIRLFAKEIGVEKLVQIRASTCGGFGTDEQFMMERLTEMCRRNSILVYAPEVPVETGDRLGFFEIFASIDSLMKRAVELVPAADTIYSLPMGGVTYIRAVQE